mmetsp:Transcript_5585/g.11128  ORF Transcript_5585/g.11128 Transcript_5585/m.11128 type:complete len:518 (+) Transcript_5585:169-1722(+)
MTVTVQDSILMNDDDASSSDEWEPLHGHHVSGNSSLGEEEEEDREARREQVVATTAAASAQQEAVDANVRDILQAVDDLLLAEETDAAKATTTSSSSFDSSSLGGSSNNNSGNGHKEKPQHDDESTSLLSPRERAAGGARTKESRLQIRQRLKKARESLRDRWVRPVTKISVSTTRRWVTGSHETRVRDFVVLPRVVKVLDKYTFTLGIMGMLSTEFVLLQSPQLFRYYFVLVMLPLLILRVVLFRRTKQQYFLLDYCYWVNTLAFVLTIVPILPGQISSMLWLSEQHQQILWQVFFISSNGPLFFAMVAWNNSLVFHSVDKVTSTYVHLFPALLSWCERWGAHGSLTAVSDLPWSRHVGYPMAFYGMWQLVYLLQTEVWDKRKLDADPELSTSLRYLSTAEKMAINRKTLKLCRSVGIMGRDETFSPPTLKVKIIFVVLQAIMSFATFLPVGFFYRSVWVHSGVVLAILTFSVYNGARYYIQVFSRIHEKRYRDDERPEEEYVDTSAVMKEHIKKS